MAVLLITHDLGVVSETADHVAVMYCGQLVEEAEVRTLFDHPLHPYTLGLLKSIPRLEDDDAKRLYMIKGTVPNPLEMPPGCHFSDRCDSCMDICRTKVPDLVDVDGHKVRCFLLRGRRRSGQGRLLPSPRRKPRRRPTPRRRATWRRPRPFWRPKSCARPS